MGIGYWRDGWRYGWRQVGWSIVLSLERYKYQHQLYYFSVNHDITFCNKHLHLQDLQSEKKETELDWSSPHWQPGSSLSLWGLEPDDWRD